MNRNALVLVAPSHTGLAQAEQAVLAHLGWQEVQAQLEEQQPNLDKADPNRWQTLLTRLNTAGTRIPGAIRQAYTTVITLSAKGTVEAFRVSVGDDPLFTIIKADSRARIQETAISAEALLPGGPYALWQQGETSRWLKDLVSAFAEFPHLPKMLNRQAILATLVQGCVEGAFVFRLRRPDGGELTFWRTRPDEASLKQPGLEVVLPEAATLLSLNAAHLAPAILPGLWGGEALGLQALYDYFSGSHVVNVQRDGYEEPVMIPAAPKTVVDEAVRAAVQQGTLWLLAGPASIWKEEVPAGVITPQARLLAPPAPISAQDLVPVMLPEAWSDGTTTALALLTALSAKRGVNLPWPLVQKALDDAFRLNCLTRTPDSGPWPCGYPGAQAVRVHVPTKPPDRGPGPGPTPPPVTGVHVAEADLQSHELQDLADAIGEVVKAAAGYPLKVHVRIQVGANPPEAVVSGVNEKLTGVSDSLSMT